MHKINVISFASGRFLKSQEILEKKCYEHGANKVYSYKKDNIDNDFIKKNYKILNQSRGAGYWIWKPYIILETLKKVNEDEVVMYLDSGMYPIDNINKIIFDEDISCFDISDQLNIKWTKYDCFYHMNCLEHKYYYSKQKNAAIQVYKNNQNSKLFLEEYLYYCENFEYNCLNDSPSIKGNEFSEFIENRHDQSIFTNLCIKYNFTHHRDPTQWGNNYTSEFVDKYPQIFNHHRGNINV